MSEWSCFRASLSVESGEAEASRPWTKRKLVYAVREGGERPERPGSTDAGARRSTRVSWTAHRTRGTRKMGAEAGGVTFATAQEAHACSRCGTKGACAGWSGAKSCVPCERISRPSTWPKAPPSTNGDRRIRTRKRRSGLFTAEPSLSLRPFERDRLGSAVKRPLL